MLNNYFLFLLLQLMKQSSIPMIILNMTLGIINGCGTLLHGMWIYSFRKIVAIEPLCGSFFGSIIFGVDGSDYCGPIAPSGRILAPPNADRNSMRAEGAPL